LGLRPARTRSSPRQPLMALAAAQAVDGGRMRSSPCGTSFIVARCPLLRGVEKGGPGTVSAWGARGQHGRANRPEGTGGPSSACPAARREEEGRGDFETILGRAWLRGTSLGKARGGSDAEAGGCRRARRGCAWERVRGRFLFGVPLFELDFLQNFE
jgi:hypothetical protein